MGYPFLGDDGRVPFCDAPEATVYLDPNGGYVCRCMVCGRCGHHTGNNTQGHYWSWCTVTKKNEGFHMCCPDNCELQAKELVDA